MMRAIVLLAAAGLGIGLPGLGHAQSFSGAEQIVGGDLQGAERAIARQRRMFPSDPDLLLNLANIYLKTGRAAAARELYRQVLARPDEELTLADGRSERAHVLAGGALRRLSMDTIATR